MGATVSRLVVVVAAMEMEMEMVVVVVLVLLVAVAADAAQYPGRPGTKYPARASPTRRVVGHVDGRARRWTSRAQS